MRREKEITGEKDRRERRKSLDFKIKMKKLRGNESENTYLNEEQYFSIEKYSHAIHEKIAKMNLPRLFYRL